MNAPTNLGMIAKRMFDTTLAILLTLLLFPLILLTWLFVYLTLGKPVWFIQPRGGLQGTVFNLIKFRTMTDVRADDGELLPDGDRIPWIGKLLRSTSLDELPQLINILKGDMSFVGPRPLHAEYLQHYSEVQARRHLMRPGITGWAQINGRNLLNWEKKFEYDVWYVNNWSFLLDVKILFKTVLIVLSGTGISQNGQATMERFVPKDAKVTISQEGK